MRHLLTAEERAEVGILGVPDAMCLFGANLPGDAIRVDLGGVRNLKSCMLGSQGPLRGDESGALF